MQAKWLTPVLIGVGALILIFSSGLDSSQVGVNTQYLKIIGLVVVMIGLYRASKKVTTTKENSDDYDENR